jgi:Arm DNA-binding domain
MRALNKRKLSPLLVTRVKPRSQAFLIWDIERGLALRVLPSGYRSFVFIYSYRGRSRWITLGPSDTISLSSARQEATRLRLAVHQGQDPASTSRASTSTGTFAVIAQRYVTEHSQRKNKSWKQAATLITRYVLPVFAEREASTISRADVRAMLAPITAPILQNQVLASTSAVFSWAVKQELLTNNPCRGVERHETSSRERVLSDAEVPLFFRAFTEAGIPGLALQVLLLTGQRPGEVAHMRHEHIADGWWTLPGWPCDGWPGTKKGCTHRVFLPERVQRSLPSSAATPGTSSALPRPSTSQCETSASCYPFLVQLRTTFAEATALVSPHWVLGGPRWIVFKTIPKVAFLRFTTGTSMLLKIRKSWKQSRNGSSR